VQPIFAPRDLRDRAREQIVIMAALDPAIHAFGYA
jgi:hypothetical protein